MYHSYRILTDMIIRINFGQSHSNIFRFIIRINCERKVQCFELFFFFSIWKSFILEKPNREHFLLFLSKS